jgi:hypothetical protein
MDVDGGLLLSTSLPLNHLDLWLYSFPLNVGNRSKSGSKAHSTMLWSVSLIAATGHRQGESKKGRAHRFSFLPPILLSLPLPLDALDNSNWKSGIAQCQRMLLKVKAGPNHHVVLVSRSPFAPFARDQAHRPSLLCCPRPSSPSTSNGVTAQRRLQISHSSSRVFKWKVRRLSGS